MITLYSTGCPKCRVLEKKLEAEEIKYTKVEDENVMIEKGFMSAPMLDVDGKVMNFKEAVDWLGEGGVGL